MPVGVGHHKQAQARQCVPRIHLHTLSARQQPARIITPPAQRDAIRIGQGRLLRRIGNPRFGCMFRQTPGLGPDALQPRRALTRTQGLQPQTQVCARTAQRITITEQGRQDRRSLARLLQHMPQPRMQRQPRQNLAMFGDPPLSQSTQCRKQSACLAQRPLGRRRQKRKFRRPPFRQFQRQSGQVRRLDFSRGIGRQGALLALGPHPIRDPFRHAPRTAPALVGLGTANPLGHQTRHSRPRIKPRPPRATAIDHDTNVRDGQRGFGNRGRQHHLAPAHWKKRFVLSGIGQRPIKRHDLRPRQVQRALDPPYLAFARQESQHPALGLVIGAGDQGRHLHFEPAFGGTVQPPRFDGKDLPFRGHDRRPAHQLRHGFRVQRCGHRHQDQIVPQRRPAFQGQCQAQIAIQ